MRLRALVFTAVAAVVVWEASAFAFHTFSNTVMPNGLAISIVEKHDSPAAVITLVLPSGSTSDPPAKRGIAAMTAKLLSAGTTSATGAIIQQRIDDLGGRFEHRSNLDVTVLQFSVLKEDVNPALELLALMVRHPTFPDDEVAAVRKERATELGSRSASSEEAILRTFFASGAYGASEGTVESLKSIRRADLVAFHRQFYQPRGACLAVAGDVSSEVVREAASKYFGDWTGGSAANRRFGQTVAVPNGTVLLLDRPLAQARTQFAYALRPLNGHDLATVTVLAQALAGGADSRLGRKLRDEKGWVYGVWTAVGPYRDVTLLSVGLSIPYPPLSDVLTEARTAIDAAGASLFTERELAVARERAKLDFYARTETLPGISRLLAEHGVATGNGRHPDEIVADIDRVTAVDVQRAARAYLARENSVVALQGDLAVIDRVAPRLGDALRAIRPDRTSVAKDKWIQAIW